jgi:hypothetical protein
MKEDEVSEELGTYVGVGKCIQGLVGKPQERRTLGRPRRGWSIILKLILNK